MLFSIRAKESFCFLSMIFSCLFCSAAIADSLADVQRAIEQTGLSQQVVAGKAVVAFLNELWIKNGKAFTEPMSYANENYTINIRPGAIGGTIPASAMTQFTPIFKLSLSA
jgi:hypothetical protein